MVFVREKNNSGFIYNINYLPKEEYSGSLGVFSDAMNNMPKSYVLYEKTEDNHMYTYIAENRMSNKILSKEIYIKNDKGQILESIDSKSHKLYSYNSNSHLLEVEDLIKKTKYTNEYDENGNCIKEFTKLIYAEYEFDANNIVIEKREFSNYGQLSLNKIEVKKIYYK